MKLRTQCAGSLALHPHNMEGIGGGEHFHKILITINRKQKNDSNLLWRGESNLPNIVLQFGIGLKVLKKIMIFPQHITHNLMMVPKPTPGG